MQDDGHFTDSQSLRRQLMSPEPMQRAIALHALETEVERRRCEGRDALLQEIGRFTARGIPYYALHDPHFLNWVGKTVTYWERLRGARALEPAFANPAHAPRRPDPQAVRSRSPASIR